MSGAVYLALHKIKSLKHLRVRLDVSPLPKMVIRHGLPPNHHSATHAQHTQSLSAPSQYVPPPPPGLGSTSTGSYPGQAGASTNNIKRKKVGGNGAPNYWANPRAFFGFKYLSTLALMGMSNLDCLQEVAECIKASSATLKSLTLTLSTDLARKARKPAPVNPELDDPSDTELDDDEFLNDPLSFPPGSSLQSSPPANEADIRKEKVAQESILARVFDLQSVAAEGRKIEKKLSLSGSQPFPEQDSEAITKKVNTLMKTLMDAPIASDTDPSSTTTRLDHFKMIREVADLYITSQSVQKKFLKDQAKPPGQPAKKPVSSSKPLNPLASDFKLSGSTIQSPGLGSSIETDLAALANSSLLGATGSSSVLNGTQKPPAPMSAWPSSSSPPYTNTNALPSTIHNSMGSTEKSKSLASSVPNTQHLIQQAQKIAQLKAQQAHVQAYMSPYSIGSYANTPVPPNALTPYQDGSNTNTGVFDATTPYSPYQPASSNGPVPTSGLNPGSLDELFLPPKNGASNITKKAKAKTQKAKKAGPAKVTAVADSGEEPETPEKTSPSATHPFFVACKTSEPAEDDMDIDMEHPDEDPEEMGEDQEILPEAEEVEVPTPRKRAKFELAESISPPLTNRESPLSPKAEATSTLDTMSSDEAMQSYIRAAHGLQLESLSLEWVPLKASIVARALDLSVLKRLTLLEVGQQDAFWTLLLRLQGTSPEISFKSIHTDNVSLPFMKFLATFEGLEELFMHERGTKQVEESATGPPISITVIRKLALQKHANTIKLLMIRNERNDSWDMDTKTLQFLAVKGTELRELGVSLNMKTYVRRIIHLKCFLWR